MSALSYFCVFRNNFLGRRPSVAHFLGRGRLGPDKWAWLGPENFLEKHKVNLRLQLYLRSILEISAEILKMEEYTFFKK